MVGKSGFLPHLCSSQPFLFLHLIVIISKDDFTVQYSGWLLIFKIDEQEWLYFAACRQHYQVELHWHKLVSFFPLLGVFLIIGIWSAEFVMHWHAMQLAGGNSALALAMTVISNMLGIMIVSQILPLQLLSVIFSDLNFQMSQVPFSLSIFIMTGRGVSVPTLELFRSLFNTLLVPLVLGKVSILVIVFFYYYFFIIKNRIKYFR